MLLSPSRPRGCIGITELLAGSYGVARRGIREACISAKAC